MSMDDGCSMVSSYEIKARLRAAMEAEHITFENLCLQSDLTESQILRAINCDPPQVTEHQHVLGKICLVLGRDLSWLLTGTDSQNPSFRETLAERVNRLVWEYVYKMRLPLAEGRRLADHAKLRVANLQCNTAHGAYRTGVPRTWRDVAQMHNRMKQR